MKSPAPKTTEKINKKRARGRADKADPASILKVWLTAWDFMRVISKNKNPSQRLSRFISIIDPKKATSEFRRSLLEAAKSAEPDKGWCETNFNFQNSEVFELYARVSLSLDPNKVVDEPVLQAFQKAKMDPENPLNWRMLMTLLCWSIFPPKRPAGRSTFWTSKRYCQLLQEIHKLKPRRQRDHWESEACDKLSNKMIFKNKHGPLSGEALRRALQQARDPEHNYTLFSLINGGLRVLEEDYKRRGHVWPPVHLEGVLARVHEIERARRQELAPAAAETMDPKCEWTEWAGGNHMALFELLQEQRARNHDGLLRALLAAGAQTYDFLVKALERRRANDHDTLQKALLGVKDYDSFLKVLEDVVADDHDSLLRAIIDNDLGDVDAFNIASVAQNWKIREAVSTALVEFYCGQIAAA